MTIEAPPRPPKPEAQDLDALIKEARRRARRRRLLLTATAALIALVATSIGFAAYFLAQAKTSGTQARSRVAPQAPLRGKLLLFSFPGHGHNVIESIRPDGTGLRRLTRAHGLGWENENVAVSPN